MEIDGSTIHRIARLARIRIDEDHINEVSQRLTQIMNWVDQLESVDTKQVSPQYGVHLESMPQREDIVNDGGKVRDILWGAPESELNMFVVPKVVE